MRNLFPPHKLTRSELYEELEKVRKVLLKDESKYSINPFNSTYRKYPLEYVKLFNITHEVFSEEWYNEKFFLESPIIDKYSKKLITKPSKYAFYSAMEDGFLEELHELNTPLPFPSNIENRELKTSDKNYQKKEVQAPPEFDGKDYSLKNGRFSKLKGTVSESLIFDSTYKGFDVGEYKTPLELINMYNELDVVLLNKDVVYRKLLELATLNRLDIFVEFFHKNYVSKEHIDSFVYLNNILEDLKCKKLQQADLINLLILNKEIIPLLEDSIYLAESDIFKRNGVLKEYFYYQNSLDVYLTNPLSKVFAITTYLKENSSKEIYGDNLEAIYKMKQLLYQLRETH